jgi:hypothetical protein
MFGRKKRQAERAFAYQTIDAKYTLVEHCRAEILDGAWFEDGSFPDGQQALERYLTYLETTDNVVYLTVNSLGPSMNQRAELAASHILEIVTRPPMPGFASPAYLAHNNLLRDLFDRNLLNEEESDLKAADSTLAFGFTRTCDPRYFPTLEGLVQQTAVTCALAAGWVTSPFRSQLTP